MTANGNCRRWVERTAVHLLAQRIRLRDLTLAPLRKAAELAKAAKSVAERPEAFIDYALEARYEVDFRFWSEAAAEALAVLPAAHLHYSPLCRRISASFRTDRDRRQGLIDRLAAVVASAA